MCVGVFVRALYAYRICTHVYMHNLIFHCRTVLAGEYGFGIEQGNIGQPERLFPSVYFTSTSSLAYCFSATHSINFLSWTMRQSERSNEKFQQMYVVLLRHVYLHDFHRLIAILCAAIKIQNDVVLTN